MQKLHIISYVLAIAAIVFDHFIIINGQYISYNSPKMIKHYMYGECVEVVNPASPSRAVNHLTILVAFVETFQICHLISIHVMIHVIINDIWLQILFISASCMVPNFV